MADPGSSGAAPRGTTSSDSASSRGASSENATQDMLRAMAHPVRLQMVERIERLGTARAADIAADMGLPANSVSYHLRILARGGVIEEAPEKARDRRDRVWKLTRVGHDHPADASSDDPSASGDDYNAAALAMSFATLELVSDAWRSLGDGSGPSRGMGHMFSTSVRVSPAQAADLGSRVSDLIQEFDRLNRDEAGADLPDGPDSDGEVGTYRVLFTLVRERPAGTGASEDSPTPSSTHRTA